MDPKKLPESVLFFSVALKRERQRRGFTQAHLSDLSGVSLATVNQVEGGRRIDPEFATLEKLAKAVGSNISNLIEDGRRHVGQDFQSVRDCVGARIRNLREERGYTKQQLGKLAGISHTYIGMVEAGKSSASVDKLCALCVVFGISLEILFHECGPE